GAGRICGVTKEHPIADRSGIDPSSVVAGACAEGYVAAWPDARQLGRDQAVYGVEGERARTIGTLAVVPLSLDGRTTGAIVLESDAPDERLAEDAGDLALLSA